MAKVSIVIPVYGVEAYIEKCARSLFEQTLEDIEYIFVDDCSPDRSIEILKCVLLEYPLRKNQVTIICTPHNSGLAAVRKYGIENATGDYIATCDSDDWPSANMYEKLYNKAIVTSSDLVVCDYYEIDDLGNTRIVTKNIENYDKESILREVLTTYRLNQVWCSLVKRDLYKKIIFPLGSQSEDKVFMIQLYHYCTKLSYLSEPLYYYRYNPTSISNSITKEKVIKRYNDLLLNREIILQFASKENLISRNKKYFDAFKFKTKDILLTYKDDYECRKLWRESYPEVNRIILFNSCVSLIDKIRFIKAYLFKK